MLSDLNLPPFEDRRRNIRLAYFYKVVEGVVPAIPPQKYLTSRKPGRNIRAKNFSDFNTMNIVSRSICNNSRGFTVPSRKTDQYNNAINIVSRSICNNSRGFTVPSCKTDQYKNSFVVKTTLDWNHLSDSFVTCDSVKGTQGI
jgi:hypothetical protein